MRLGEKQVLTVVKIVDFGMPGNDEERVLLPKKRLPRESNREIRSRRYFYMGD